MTKENLLTDEQIRTLINDSLYEKDLINEELHEKCGKPKHIQALPHDLRTNDPEKLQSRKDAIIKEWKKTNEEIGAKNYPEEFWDLAQGDGEIYDDDLERPISVVADRVIEHYDNLLKTKSGLNDMIRERYDEQINKLTEENKGLKTIMEDFDKKDMEKLKEIDGIKTSISGTNRTITAIKDELSSTQATADIRANIQAELDDGNAVIERFLEANHLPYGDSSYYFIENIVSDSKFRNQINEDYEGLGDYIYHIQGLKEDLKLYESPEYYDNKISKLRNRRDKLQSGVDSLERKLSDARREEEYYHNAWEGGRRVYDNNYARIQKLRANKPNKSQKNDKNYQELVDKKNLAIQFKNDCRKASDFQEELKNVNLKLGASGDDAFEMYDGIPQNRYGFIDIY